MAAELTKKAFTTKLVKAGWKKKDAEKEWEDLQDEDESGYDGP